MTFSRGKTVLLRPSGVLMVRWYVLNLLGCGAVPWILPILFETLSCSIGSAQKEMQIALASEWKQRGENENNIGERASQTLRLISSSLLKFQEFGLENFRSGVPGSVTNRGVFSDDKATIWKNRCVSKWRRKEEKKEKKEGGSERITKSERSEGCSLGAHSTGKGPGAGKGSVCSKMLPWFQDHYNQFCWFLLVSLRFSGHSFKIPDDISPFF